MSAERIHSRRFRGDRYAGDPWVYLVNYSSMLFDIRTTTLVVVVNQSAQARCLEDLLNTKSISRDRETKYIFQVAGNDAWLLTEAVQYRYVEPVRLTLKSKCLPLWDTDGGERTSLQNGPATPSLTAEMIENLPNRSRQDNAGKVEIIADSYRNILLVTAREKTACPIPTLPPPHFMTER